MGSVEEGENSNWLFDYDVLGEALPALESDFNWQSDAFINSTTPLSAEFVDTCGNTDIIKEYGSRKRKSSSCNAPDSKACREKMRRDKLNDRFQELSLILEPGRPPKVDKVVILSDAVQTVTQLRNEANKLKESHEDLQEKIKELKVEKNELREEKQKLKGEKERLEQQLKALSTQPSFMPPPPFAMPAQYGIPGQIVGNKMVPFMGYPGVSMWPFMPPAAVDTSQDHVLRPPVA